MDERQDIEQSYREILLYFRECHRKEYGKDFITDEEMERRLKRLVEARFGTANEAQQSKEN